MISEQNASGGRIPKELPWSGIRDDVVDKAEGLMNRRRIVVEEPRESAFARKLRRITLLTRIGLGALRARNFIHAKPVFCTFLGLGTGFVVARAFGSRR